MKFKKLEVAGFKSFADRLEVKFGAGVTAIVGPNGCGKSNVADSIRWVLGEQSAKLLRGSSMQDVIFNGTEKRKSLSYCEVNLYFDNTEKLFPSLEYDEVVISRKLYRSGESEYCLNKTQCRLKDITDLLRDAGMGREGYSIIGQGRIDELLSAKPEDRRAIFEEAAGISKFKAKKVDAERKLARTRENLLRINDILEEKSRLLEPLTKQSEAARKWLDLRDKLKFHEINIYIYQYDTASQAKAVIGDRLNGVLEAIDLRQKECDEATADYNEAMRSLASVDKTIEELREELLQLTVGLEKQAGEIKLLNERRSYLVAQNERVKAENEQLDADYRQTLDFIEQGGVRQAERAQVLAKQQASAERFNAEYLQVVETLTQGEGEVESNHRAVLEAMDKLTEIRSNLSRMLAEREARGKEAEDLTRRIALLNERIAQDSGVAAALRGEIDARVDEKNGLSREIETLYARNNECLAGISQCASEIDGISAKFYAAKTRHKMLSEMQQTYEGFAYSVKKLLSDAQNDRQVSTRIEGVVSKLIRVREGFETAIEMALGNAVQNIVTKDEEDAKYLIAYLKEKRYGRVTFLPISSLKPRSIDGDYRALLQMPGCFGVAGDLVACDERYNGIVAGLLGGTVVVDNMDTAIALARKSRYGFKIVTLDGDIVNPHGSITGGSKKSELTNVFGYDKEIAALTAEIDDMQKRLDTCNERRDTYAATQNETAKAIVQLRERIHACEVEIAAKNETVAKLTTSVDDLTADAQSLTQQCEAAQQRIAAITDDLNSVGELEQLIAGKKDSANEVGNEQRQQFEALRKRRDELHGHMTDARVQVQALESELLSIESEIKRLQANVQTMAGKIEYNNRQIAENDELIARIDDDMKGFTTTGKETDTDRVRAIRSKLGNLDEYKQDMQSKVAKLDNTKMELMNALQALHEKKSQEEMQLLKVDTDIEQMQEHIKETYDMEYADCLPFKEEGYDTARGIPEFNRISRQMRALGDVNLSSIEQCQQLYVSYHEMDVQREDLVKAEGDLIQIIKELSQEMIGRFTTQFEQIRANFVKIFRELFDGGTADLILLESENLLEAGIEIVAQPPQKKLQSISLLSGGERALTAIAILFAILRLKPMPFCVLDEIEAALDDANAGRFAKYLRRFSEETQFIVITHRKPTMELADNLYGVTMEEKGVSKIVSVKLSEAVAYETNQ